MAIPTPQPIVKEPIQGKTFNEIWIRNFATRTQGPDSGSLYIETIAYDSASQEVDNGLVVDEIREDMIEILQNVPEAAVVYQSFLQGMEAALPAIRDYIAEKNAQNEETP
jgi:hypothetical protein